MSSSPTSSRPRHRSRRYRFGSRLTSSKSIAEIGRIVGWPQQNYFARRFRSVFGMAPTAYRKQLPIPALAPQLAGWIDW
jgi:AraC-like DNA-binding protein